MLKSVCVQILNVREISLRPFKMGRYQCLITIFILFCPMVKTNQIQTIYLTVSTLYILILSASVAAVNSGRMGLYVFFHVHLASRWECFLLCTVQSTSAANLLCSNICFSCNTASCCCTFTSACSWDCCSYLLYYRYLFLLHDCAGHDCTPEHSHVLLYLKFFCVNLSAIRAFSTFAFELDFIRSSSFSLSSQPVKAQSSSCQL